MTAALVAGLLSIGAGAAVANTTGGVAASGDVSWGAQLPPRMNAKLFVPIFEEARQTTLVSDAPPAQLAESFVEPAVCVGCTPPLTYHGGAIMGTTAQAGAITITPIYWVPGTHSMTAIYKSLINQYIADVAADSGKGSNVYAINAEYSRATTPAGGDQIKYAITSGTPITDTTAYPGTCTPDPGYTACVTEGDLRARLSALIASTPGLSADLAHIYPVFFPDGVDFVNESGKHKDSGYCAYHGAYVSTVPAGPVIFATEPFPGDGCGLGQFPSYGVTGDVDSAPADASISILSHEINEAITDPQLSFTYGWYDATGNEIGDECASHYGAPLGSTDTSTPVQTQQTAYNQVINGHRYYTQLSFSNATFAKFGMAQGCVGKAFQPQGAAEPTTAAPDIIDARINAIPNHLPADGTSTSTITIVVTRNNGEPVVGDHVSFIVATAAGEDGVCGELSDSGGSPLSDGGMTDADGQVTVTYTASDEDATCSVIANDFESGTSTVANISQGADAQDDPFIVGTLPTELTAGAPPVTFEIIADNPSLDDVTGTRITVWFDGDNTATTGLEASQVNLSYSDDSTGGQMVRMPLSGTTVNDGSISGFVLPEQGTTLPGDDFRTTTFQLSLAADAPNTTTTGSPLRIEFDLDQINPADGSARNLEYIDPSSTVVRAAATPPPVTPPAAATPTPPAAPEVITVTVPGPAKGCTVPTLVGRTYTNAKARIKKAACPRLTITRPSGRTPKGKQLVVKSASPKPGTVLAADGTVRVTLQFKKK